MKCMTIELEGNPMSKSPKKPLKLRSQNWFDNPDNADMTALYLERYLNYGFTRGELQGAKPIIGIAQTGSDLSPCNRSHVELAKRVRDGIIAAGGVPLEFPIHPMQETGKRTHGKVKLWPATLYGTIKQLLEADLIEEKTENEPTGSSAERRRSYALTHLGRQVLIAESDRLRELVHFLDSSDLKTEQAR